MAARGNLLLHQVRRASEQQSSRLSSPALPIAVTVAVPVAAIVPVIAVPVPIPVPFPVLAVVVPSLSLGLRSLSRSSRWRCKEANRGREAEGDKYPRRSRRVLPGRQEHTGEWNSRPWSGQHELDIGESTHHFTTVVVLFLTTRPLIVVMVTTSHGARASTELCEDVVHRLSPPSL